ncbi:MAG: cell division protein FtsX [Alphaproteobacteria bacterium]
MSKAFQIKLPLKQTSPFFLSWITMLMTFVAALTLFASISMNNIINHWNNVISGSLTIQQPTYDLTGVNREEAALKELTQITELLKQQPFVVNFHVLTNEEMDKLMNPWLGELSQINELPIPKLVDVKLDKSVPFSLDMFKTELNAIAPYAQVDSHRIWLSNLIDIAGGIQKTILIILTLLILTTAFTVIYTTRSGLLVQSGTLNLLQMMGAKDFTIAFNVAFHAFWKSFLGGIIGFLFSLPVVLIVITLVESQNDSLFTFGALNKMQWICVCTLPFIVGALAFITALLTAFKKLRAF